MMSFQEFVNMYDEVVPLMYREGSVISKTSEGYLVVGVFIVITYRPEESEQFIVTDRLNMVTKLGNTLLEALPHYMRTSPSPSRSVSGGEV